MEGVEMTALCASLEDQPGSDSWEGEGVNPARRPILLSNHKLSLVGFSKGSLYKVLNLLI